MRLNFTKMHGLGNDYVFVNCLTEKVADPASVSKVVSDRHFGVGSDGLVLIESSSQADFGMRIFNADGSEAEMCGNAIRCVGKFLVERGLTNKHKLAIETKGGIKFLELVVKAGKVGGIRVDMGRPILESAAIPVAVHQSRVIAEDFQVAGQNLQVTCVSMGNPHAVFFVPEISDDLVLGLGPKIEKHPWFPNRTNVEFIKILNRSALQMRVWERGSGETMACGSGACAATVAAALNNLADREVTVHLRGGDLKVHWADDDHVFKEGPAAFAFDGWTELLDKKLGE